MNFKIKAPKSVGIKRNREFLSKISIELLANVCDENLPLALAIQGLAQEIEKIKPGENLDRRIADYIYQLVAVAPLTSAMSDANKARNIATLSSLFATFQQFYGYSVITSKNLISVLLLAYGRWIYRETI